MMTSNQQRALIRQQRRQLSTEFVQQTTNLICQQIIATDIFKKSQHIGAYLAHDSEANTTACIQQAILEQKKIYLPVINANKTFHFYHYYENMPLLRNCYDILEPDTKNQSPIETQSLDLILMPLVAFDKHGHRLGMGQGYYDRTLQFLLNQPAKEKRPLLIGLAYEFQKIDTIEAMAWDVPLNVVVTEKEIYNFDT